MLTEFYNE